MFSVMVKITEEEWQKLYENFDTHSLLEAVDHIDEMRGHTWGTGQTGNRHRYAPIF